MAGRGKANGVDAHVGQAIKLRRVLLGISQEELARHLGLTFQQIQKFESGTNRVSASHLVALSQALDVPISYFFSALEGLNSYRAGDQIDGFWLTYEGLALWMTYRSVSSENVRKRFIDLVKSIAAREA
ncbi:MAG TPA: helix-turn-helix transcriptional regulator [Rhizomicrobium sp.]|jgi:transcriptional regulator with XRE-family HTH domain